MRTQEHRAVPAAATRVTRLVRSADQVDLEFHLVNLTVDPKTNRLEPVDAAEPTFVRIVVGSQHTVEDATVAGDAAPDAPVAHRSAAPSRLVVDVSGGRYTVAALLRMVREALLLDGRADPRSKPTTGPPSDDVTALEVPEGLVLSPIPPFRFTAATAPRTHGDVTEVWTARLGTEEATPLVRAIHNRHADDDLANPAVDAEVRDLLVDATRPPGDPIEADRLWLSSHGAFARLRGAWDSGDLASYWQHIAAGRDVEVETVLRGYLAPFGHRATVATITERVMEPNADGELVAHLVQHEYLAIAEPTVSNPALLAPHGGRGLPFTSITVVDAEPLPVGKAAVPLPDGDEMQLDNAWIISDPLTGDDRRLVFSATDRSGNDSIDFTLPVVFVTDSMAHHVQDTVNGRPTVPGNLVTFYADVAGDDRRVLDLGGLDVAWAEPTGQAGSTKTTNRIELRLGRPDYDGMTAREARELLEEAGQPAFGAVVGRAWVVDDAAAALMGGPSSPAAPETVVEPTDAWLEHGLDAGNVDLSFLRVSGTDPGSLEFSGNGAGLVAPQLNVDTFSQALGSGIGLTDGATWDPLAALGDSAELFGIVSIAELVDEINVAIDGLEAPGLPKFELIVEGGDDPLELPTKICNRMTWEPQITSWPSTNPVLIVADDLADNDLPAPWDQPTRASMLLEQCVPLDGTGVPGTELDIRIERVAVRLPPLVPGVVILFDEVRYHQLPGEPGQVTTALEEWLFVGFLGWLDPVREFLLEILELGDIEIGERGIFVDFDVPVPSLGIGVVGVTDLDVGLGLDLPSDGASGVRFALSERADPFAITLFGAGGSGSFELELSANDIVLLEGSLAVTYELSVDIFVARAELSAALGASVRMQNGAVELGVYVELRGNASILGLVDVTGKVTLALVYHIGTKLLRGVATVTGEVDSLFGKSDVSFEVDVEVPLGDGAEARALAPGATASATGLSFSDRFTSDQWTEYCNAYA